MKRPSLIAAFFISYVSTLFSQSLTIQGRARSASDIDLNSFVTDKDAQVENIYTANPDDFKKGMENFYTPILNSLQPGHSIFIIHTAYDDNEMQAITVDHPEWGAAWRQADYHFFTGDNCKKILKEKI